MKNARFICVPHDLCRFCCFAKLYGGVVQIRWGDKWHRVYDNCEGCHLPRLLRSGMERVFNWSTRDVDSRSEQ